MEIELGTLKAKVQEDNVLMLKVQVASGTFEKNGKKLGYDICQGAGSGNYIINIDGKKNVVINLQELMGMVLNKFDEIPNTGDDMDE